jgi:hypothetical protein
MKAAFLLLATLVVLGGLPADAYAIIPCIKEQVLDNEFIDEDTRSRGRLHYKARVSEMATAPEHEADGTLTIVDVATGKRLTIRWAVEADSITLAHAAYLAALHAAVFDDRPSATGIRFRRLDIKGDVTVGADAALRLAALVAGGYAISGGSDYTDAIHRVADDLDLTLPDLLARAR